MWTLEEVWEQSSARPCRSLGRGPGSCSSAGPDSRPSHPDLHIQPVLEIIRGFSSYYLRIFKLLFADFQVIIFGFSSCLKKQNIFYKNLKTDRNVVRK